MPDYSSDNPEQSTWGQVRPRQTLLQRVPLSFFYFFNVTYKTGRASKVPPLDFFRHCATFFRKFFNVPKGSPLWVFWYFATECLLINPEGSPFLHFSALCDFFWKKNFLADYFSKKSVLRFLSLRYGADFRRSRLVFFFRLQSSHWSVHFSYKSYNLKILQFLLSKFK